MKTNKIFNIRDTAPISFESDYEHSFISIMTEILVDRFPEKALLLTADLLLWFKLSRKAPIHFLNMKKLVIQMYKASWSHEPDSSMQADLDLCSDPKEIKNEILKSNLTACIIDHSIFDSTIISNKILNLLPKRISNKKHLKDNINEAACAALLWEIASIKDIEEVVIILPQTVLSLSIYSYFRSAILKHFNLKLVIDLPAGIYLPDTNEILSLLYIERVKSHKRCETIFYNLNQRGDLLSLEHQSWFKDLKSSLAGSEPQQGFAAVVSEKGTWHSLRYHPAIAGRESFFLSFSGSKKLRDIFDVFRGVRFRFLPQFNLSGEPLIRGRDINDRGINKNELDRIRVNFNTNDKLRTQPGDILINVSGKEIKAVTVTNDLKGLIVESTVFILRPKSKDFSSELITQYLNSDAAKLLIGVRCLGTPRCNLTITVLKDIPIPIFPEWASQHLCEMNKLEKKLIIQAEKVRSMRLKLFDAKDKVAFEEHLSYLQQQNQILSSSLAQADELSFQIRNYFPFPLAFPFRLLQGIVDYLAIYKEQLRVAENVLAFLGSVSLAIVHTQDKDLLENVKRNWRHGISPGHWKDIAIKSFSILKEMKENPLATGMYSLWYQGRKESTFSKNLGELIKSTNDFKHNRGPQNVDEYKRSCEITNQRLILCMEKVAFFIQHPIRLISDYDLIRGTSSFLMHVLLYRGDHPALSQEKIEYPKPLSKNTLFIEISSNNWLSLYPFITVQNCPKCNIREIFFIDKWEGIGKAAFLKSFERGHQFDSQELGKDLDKIAI